MGVETPAAAWKDANGEKWFLEVIGEDLTVGMTSNPISKADPCGVK